MAVRGGWRPLSGLICEIVNSVCQGNFTFVWEKSGKIQGISNTYGCGNHASGGITCLSLFPSRRSESRMRKLQMSCGSKWQILSISWGFAHHWQCYPVSAAL